ncbi:MAG TPA: GGDEF domain-containing protein [Burkholderiaceae bacterium]|nr:GGDEF domain-containing protein [Burkholderiaceae bacterium]HNG80285.1 GGDEF domain-containing protein [Burkholderiaceae bacterium]
MQRFATDDAVASAQARVADLRGDARAAALAELAWHLRQRETQRALLLCDQAEAQPSAHDDGATRARLRLVRAEAAWLMGDLDAAERWLDQARSIAPDDAAVLGDADWLDAALVNDRGRYDQREIAVARSGERAAVAGDTERADLARLALQCFAAFGDPGTALAEHGDTVRARLDDPCPAVAALAQGFMHHGLASVGRYAEAITHGLRAAELALQTGQVRRALIDTTNAATIYLDLNDVDAALALLNDNLARARSTGWPQTTGITLAGTSLAMLRAGRHEAAIALADEALEVLRGSRDAKPWYIAAQARASIAVDQRDWATARRWCETILAAPMQGDMSEMRRFACHALSEALSGQGEASAARSYATQALDLAERSGDLTSQIDAHRLLARIAHQTPAGQASAGQESGALASLRHALAIANAHADITTPVGLLDELAAEQQRAGHLQDACETWQRAAAARDAQGRHDANLRAVALEVRFKTERALADAQRQRELAEAEARRARELALANDRLRAALAELEAAQGLLTRRNTELREAYAAMKDLSLTDPLTGLRNRRFLSQAIDQDVAHALRRHEARAQRASQVDGGHDARSPGNADLLFFLIDLDHFKAVNDRYGHAAGDAVLVELKNRLQGVFRDSDHIVRWGGEEFLVVARSSRREFAAPLAERLRRRVAEQPFVLPDGTSLAQSCSIGYAVFPADPARPREGDWMSVVERADQRLYEAKARGRNRWVGEPGDRADHPQCKP